MGKSPGKWIKTLLFGKKSSKSNLSKGRDSFKSTEEKGTLVSAQAADSIRGPPDRNARNSELENGVASNSLHNGVVITPGSQGADVHTTIQSVATHNPERIRQERAATKAQAAFRGYLARRAFRALRGIIRLQALVRGHLVRRQAIATLRCMQGIVKFQALIRGSRVRCSDVGIEVNEKCNKRLALEDANHLNTFGVNTTARREKFWANAFICNHVASSPTVIPLHLQYGRGEPNSAWSWLEVWSFSRIWEPLPHPKKVVESKSQARPKRCVRGVPGANVDNGSVRSSSESEKPKRNLRKVLSHPVDLVQESLPNDLEKVKRGLKKTSNSRNETVDRIEAESEMPKQIHRKASCSLAPDASNSDMVESSEKTKKEMSAPVSKYHDTESPSLALATNKTADVLHDDQFDTSPLGSSGKDENIHVTNGELISKQGKTSNENQKGSKRRASFPTKQEYSENGGYNSPKLPSYMQATESAKAKLRGLGSPKPDLDGSEQIALTRRHSLPSATNGKLSSLSPRAHKLEASGKAGVKNDRSLMSSRDGNEKGVQAEWRR